MDELSKRGVIAILTGLGYKVESIQETDEPRADLLACDGTVHYAIEIKDKVDTGSQIERDEILFENAVAEIGSEPHSRWNRLHNILLKANDQLETTPKPANCFNLVWLILRGHNAEMLARRFLYTFYGVADLTPRFPGGYSVHCLYFDFASAWTFPRIHGIVIDEREGCQVALNEFSEGYETFRASDLVQRFGSAVYDPRLYSQDPGTIILRSDIPRKDESQVLDEVMKQTGKRYTRTVLQRHTFGARSIEPQAKDDKETDRQ